MKKLIILILIVSVTVRIAYFFFEPDLCTDHISQMATSNNLLNGHGISLAYTDISDISKPVYKTHIQWPPLYATMLSSISIITGNHLVSSFLIRVLICVLLVFIWNKIIKSYVFKVSEDFRLLFLSVIVISTSIFNSLNTILVVPLLLFSFSFYFSLTYMFHPEGKKTVYLFLASFFSGSLFWTHYSFVLPAFYLPGVFLLLFLLKKERRYFSDAVISFTIILMLTLSLFLYNIKLSGSLNYMDNPELWQRGIFLNHLLAIKPFFVDAFFKTEYFEQLLKNSGISNILHITFHALSFFILIILASVLYKNKENWKSPGINANSFAIMSFFFFILLSILLLSYFSLTYKELPSPGWTHIGEARYWGNIYLLIIFITVLSIGFLRSDWQIQFSKIILIVIILFNLGANIMIINNNIHSGGFDLRALIGKDQLKDLYFEIDSLRSEGKNVVFADTDISVRSARMASLAGGSLFNPDLWDEDLKIPENTVIVFGLYKNENVFVKEKVLRTLAKTGRCEKFGMIGDDFILYKIEH